VTYLYKKLCLDSSRCLGLSFTSYSAQRIYFVDKDNCWLVFPRHRKQLFHEPAVRNSSDYIRPRQAEKDSGPLALSHPLADQVTRAHAEERALSLGRNRLCQITLSRPRRTIQQYSPPGSPFAGKQVGKLDGKDDSLFKRLFGGFETGYVFPSDIGGFADDSA
jgi:hypothetical protein